MNLTVGSKNGKNQVARTVLILELSPEQKLDTLGHSVTFYYF